MAKDLQEMTLEELWQLFPIELAEHDPMWADWYEEERAALHAALGDAVQRIDHIGSTSVAGLLAKPIVDILLQVAPECDTAWLYAQLEQDGWLLMAEQKTPDEQSDWNKGYTPQGFAEKVFHLHVRQSGDWDELYFRDYLAAHPEAAEQYAALKRALLVEHKYNRDAYTEAKGAFVQACTQRAREERTGGV